jgi:hypothetical protein
MAWDFSDSSFRPSIVLKATHSKLTSMEFLTGNTLSLKHQLLAAGDETGTLHIFEMPRSLVRPAHKEAALMSAFLDREREVRTTVVLLRQNCLKLGYLVRILGHFPLFPELSCLISHDT